MLIVGLTGGIGSGKSEVAKQFAKLNIEIIDCDEVAREIVAPGQHTLGLIIEHFGEDMLLEGGELNRRDLGELIFHNEEERKWLEDLLHPLIRDKIKTRLKKISSPYCVVVVPLLVESGKIDYVNHILVVDAPDDLRKKRAMKRDNLTAEHAEKIMQSQASREERLEAADEVIENDAGIDKLEKQVKDLHQRYLKMS